MKYIIYGAGERGRDALNALCYPRVECFLDRDKNKKSYLGKRVISFDELTEEDIDSSIFVIASDLYWEEMERQLKTLGDVKCFVFRNGEFDSVEMPHYYFKKFYEPVSYARILDSFEINKYKRIAIWGANVRMPYLLSEIAFQNSLESVVEIIGEKDDNVQTIGVPVVSSESMDKNIDCLIVNAPQNMLGLTEVLESLPADVDILNLYYDSDIVESSFKHPELKKFKDIHKGKRIFVIGNGPSLRPEDLDKLHENNEICFGFNMIYRAFDKTSWRPTYMGISDPGVINICKDMLDDLPGTLFIADTYHHERPENKPNSKKMNEFHLIKAGESYYPNKPGFSSDITRGAYTGHTVTYDIGLQFAHYMGAKEIILLGVDNNFGKTKNKDTNHFIKNYFTENEMKKEFYYINDDVDIIHANNDKAFEKAEEYSRKHGFRIYNATRGGCLEAFERIDFDSLFDAK